MRRRCRMHICWRRTWLLLFVRNSCLYTRKLLAFQFPFPKKKLPTTLQKKDISWEIWLLIIPWIWFILIYRPICHSPSSSFGEACLGEEATSWATSSWRFRSVLYTYYIAPLPSPPLPPFTKKFRISLPFLLLIGTPKIWFWEMNSWECAVPTN